jgi:hypothetical protein
MFISILNFGEQFMKTLKIAIFAICLHAPFTNAMSMEDEIGCSVNTFASGATFIAGIGLTAHYLRQRNAHMNYIKKEMAKFDRERQEEHEGQGNESNIHPDARHRTAQEIEATRQWILEGEFFELSLEAIPGPACCISACCTAYLAWVDCSK